MQIRLVRSLVSRRRRSPRATGVSRARNIMNYIYGKYRVRGLESSECARTKRGKTKRGILLGIFSLSAWESPLFARGVHNLRAVRKVILVCGGCYPFISRFLSSFNLADDAIITTIDVAEAIAKSVITVIEFFLYSFLLINIMDL